MKNLVLFGFQELFQTRPLTSPCDSEVSSFSYIFFSKEERSLLISPVLEEEIMQGLWALKPFKAPRPDGLHVAFFQYFWADIRLSVCKEISNNFEKRAMLDFLMRP